LSVYAGGTLSNNTYTWYKLGLSEETRDTTVIKGDSVFYPKENGLYRAKVINSVATKLKLHSVLFRYKATDQPVIASSENALQQNNKTNLFRVYPNPVKDILHIETNGNAAFSLIDQSGKIISTSNINGQGSINISGITPGLYYLKNNSTGNVQKVVIAR
jgi:hypothetical protein